MTSKNRGSPNFRPVLASLVLLCVSAGVYFIHSARIHRIAERVKNEEIRELDARFETEKRLLLPTEDSASLIARLKEIEADAKGSLKPLHISSRSWEGFETTIRFERMKGESSYFILEKKHTPLKAGFAFYPILYYSLTLGMMVSLLLFFFGLLKREAAPSLPSVPVVPSPPKNEFEIFLANRRYIPPFTDIHPR